MTNLMNSPKTQLYSLILLGIIVSFMWPINLIYVFILTRAYSRDHNNLFQSFYLESVSQGKNTIDLIKEFINKVKQDNLNNTKNTKNDKKTDSDDASLNDKSDITVNSDGDNTEPELRKRNTVANLEEKNIDTI